MNRIIKIVNQLKFVKNGITLASDPSLQTLPFYPLLSPAIILSTLLNLTKPKLHLLLLNFNHNPFKSNDPHIC